MMPTLKCSIIIPAYNVSKYLSDCLDSVFSQLEDKTTYEVIVVDDCSPDNEKDIVNSYTQLYPNIRYIRHDVNKSLGGARNTGIYAAQGEYVMFLDADDILVDKNTLSVFFEFIDKYNPLVLCSNSFYSISSESHYEQLAEMLGGKDQFRNDNVEYISYTFYKWRLSDKFSCSVWGTMYKRSFLLERNLFFREHVFYEDSDWKQKIMFYANNRIGLLDFTCYGYRQSPGGITRARTIRAFESNAIGIIETYLFYKEKVDWNDDFGTELQNRFARNIIGLLKISSHYPISASYNIFRKINSCGLTTLRAKSLKNKTLMCLVRYIPLCTIISVKIYAKFKL